MSETTDITKYAVLYVDDEEQALKYFRRGFDKQFRILSAPNVAQAISLLEDPASAIGVVISDQKMPWPELFDAEAADNQKWNSITLGQGINGIPTMFLIDKKGIVRTVSARENMEEMIPKLLSEAN